MYIGHVIYVCLNTMVSLIYDSLELLLPKMLFLNGLI